MPDEPDLELVETEALVKELMRRSVALAIARLPKGDKRDVAIMDYDGGRFQCLGLVAQMQHDLTHSADVIEKDDDDA